MHDDSSTLIHNPGDKSESNRIDNVLISCFKSILKCTHVDYMDIWQMS